jgi:hypothetical protein
MPISVRAAANSAFASSAYCSLVYPYAVGGRHRRGLPTAASLPRGDLSAIRVHSTAFLRDVEAKPDSPKAVVAHRAAGIARRVGGSIWKRGNVLSRLWPCFRAGHDNSLAFRFGHDVGVAAMPCLGLTLWLLRDIGRAISLVGDGEAGITALAHVGTRAWRTLHAARSR